MSPIHFLGLVAIFSLRYIADASAYSETRSYTQEVVYESGKKLFIDTEVTDITITGEERNDIVAVAEVEVSHKDAKRVTALFDRISLVPETDARGHHLRLQILTGKDLQDIESGVSRSAVLHVLIPTGQSLQVNNTFGDVTVEKAENGVRIVNQHGRVAVRQCKDEVDVKNLFGAIEIADIDGRVLVVNGHGNVSLQNVKGDASVNNQFKPIHVEHVSGSLKVRSAQCEIKVKKIGGHCDITSDFKPVSIQQVDGSLKLWAPISQIKVNKIGEDCEVFSSFGSVVVDHVGGNISVNGPNSKVEVADVEGDTNVRTAFNSVVVKRTSGSIVVEGGSSSIEVSEIKVLPPEGQIKLKTTGKPITLFLPPDANVRIFVPRHSGQINSSFPVNRIDGADKDGPIDAGEANTKVQLWTDQDITIKSK